MTAAMIALVAGLAVASGPERIPTEVKQTLDLRGYWEGTWHGVLPCGEPGNSKARLKPGRLRLTAEQGAEWEGPCRFLDEGAGKCRTTSYLGIYKWEGNRVIICLGAPNSRQRPTGFGTDNYQNLLILKPAKPWK